MAKYKSGIFIYDKTQDIWEDICNCKQRINNILESPIDKKQYIYKNNEWVPISCIEVKLCLTPSADPFIETDLVVFNVISQGVSNGETFNWEVVPVTVSDDNIDYDNYSGTVTINDNKGSISFQSLCDNLTEGDEVFDINLFDEAGDLVSTYRFILEDFCLTPEPRFHTLGDVLIEELFLTEDTSDTTGSGLTIEEQLNSITFKVKNTVGGDLSGTQLFWEVEFNDANLTPDDFASATSGVLNMGTESSINNITLTAACENVTEEVETFNVHLYDYINNTKGNTIYHTITVSIEDFCKTPEYRFNEEMYQITEDTNDPANSVNIIIENRADGLVISDTLYYLVEFDGNTLTSGDLTIAGMTIDANGNGVGEVNISNNSGSLTVSANCDNITDPDETFIIRLFSDSSRTEEIDMSEINVIDFCLTPEYRFNEEMYQITEDENASNNSVAILIENRAEGLVMSDTVYYLVEFDGNTLTSDDLTIAGMTIDTNGNGVGEVNISNNNGSLTVSANCDYITDPDETFTIRLFSDSSRSEEIDVAEINVIDFCEAPDYEFTESSYQITEDENASNNSVVMQIENLSSGIVTSDTLYYLVEFNGTNLIPGDLTIPGMVIDDNGNGIGEINITNNSGSLTVSANCDNITDPDETFSIRLFLDSARSIEEANTTVNVIDFCETVEYKFTESSYQITEDENASNNSVVMRIENQAAGNVIASDTLYYQVEFNGTNLTPGDLTIPGMTINGDGKGIGVINISNNSGSLTVSANCDNITDPNETFTIRVFSDSDRTTEVDRTTVNVIDFCLTPNYQIEQDLYILTEDESQSNNTVDIIINNNSNGATVNNLTLYYKIEFDNTRTFEDIIISGLQIDSDNNGIGQVVINNNTGVITVTAVCDNLTEGDETFNLTIYSDANRTDVLDNTQFRIIDFCLTPPEPKSFSVSASPTIINETSDRTTTFTIVDTSQTPEPFTTYYEISGVQAEDIDVSLASTITSQPSNGGHRATLFITATEDSFTEGTETMTVIFYSDNTKQEECGRDTVTIQDTSTTPPEPKSFNVFASPIIINETTDRTTTFTIVDASQTPEPFTSYYEISGVQAEDINVQLTGTITSQPSNGGHSATLSVTANEDNFTEGDETMTVIFYSDNTKQEECGRSTVTIQDTSTTPPEPAQPKTFDVEASPTVINETNNNTTTFTVNDVSLNPEPFTTYYEIIGVQAEDIDVPLTDTITSQPSNGGHRATLIITATEDNFTEGDETMTVIFYSDNTKQEECGRDTVTIEDTSITPPAPAQPKTFDVEASPTVINETNNNTTRFTVNDVSFNPEPFTTYYEISGVQAEDIDVSLTGTINSQPSNGGHRAILEIMAVEDSFTEGNETMTVIFYSDNTKQEECGRDTVTIEDSSKSPEPKTFGVQASPDVINETNNNTTTFTVSDNTFNPQPFSTYYEIIGVQAEDIDVALTGTINSQPNNGGHSARLVINAVADNFTEGNETMTVIFFSDDTKQEECGRDTVTIEDSSKSPAPKTFDVEASPTSINETNNNTTTFTVNDVSFNPEPFTTYYEISGVQAEDIDVSLTGTITSQPSNGGHRAVLVINAVEDSFTEGTETMTVIFYSDNTKQEECGRDTVTIEDTSRTPAPKTFNVQASPDVINETNNNTTTFTVNDTSFNPQPFTTYYEISGVQAEDIDVALTGTINSSPSNGGHRAILEINAVADNFTEGDETMTVIFYSDNTKQEECGRDTVTIQDTSKTPPPKTFDVQASPTSINETNNNTTTFTVSDNSFNPQPFTTYYEISGVQAEDIDKNLTGTITSQPNNGGHVARLVINAVADNFTEGTETMTVIFYSDNTKQEECGRDTVTIEDTSKTPPPKTFDVQASPTSINETNNRKTVFTVSDNTFNPQPFSAYYEISGVQAEDIDKNLTGTITSQPNNGGHRATLEINAIQDNFTEGTETMTVIFYSDNTKQEECGRDTVTIEDTSKTPPPKSFNVQASPKNINETDNNTTVFTITNTTFNPQPFNTYYEITGVLSNDINKPLTGTISSQPSNNGSHKATLSITALEDNNTDGNKNMVVTFYSDSTKQQICGSDNVVIEDTSQTKRVRKCLNFNLEVNNIGGGFTSNEPGFGNDADQGDREGTVNVLFTSVPSEVESIEGRILTNAGGAKNFTLNNVSNNGGNSESVSHQYLCSDGYVEVVIFNVNIKNGNPEGYSQLTQNSYLFSYDCDNPVSSIEPVEFCNDVPEDTSEDTGGDTGEPVDNNPCPPQIVFTIVVGSESNSRAQLLLRNGSNTGPDRVISCSGVLTKTRTSETFNVSLDEEQVRTYPVFDENDEDSAAFSLRIDSVEVANDECKGQYSINETRSFPIARNGGPLQENINYTARR